MRRIAIVLIMLIGLTSIVKGQDVSGNKYAIRLLGEEVNNEYSNFGTVYYGTQVVFSSPARRNYIIRNVWSGNEQPYLDLYVGEVGEKGSVISVRKFSNKLNTKYHESQVCFTRDLSRVYFTRNNYYKGIYTSDTLGVNRLQLYTAEVDSEGAWKNVKSLPFNNKDYSVGHPTLSPDDKTLYFVSDQPGGYGSTDIYKVSVLGNNQYGEIENLGEKINTSGKEMFPYVTEDEFYYSTDGMPQGKGGLDIYVLKLDEEKPKNLVNINSEKDDFGFIIDNERRDGYFSSNRSGGYGDDDIYYFDETDREKPQRCIYTVVVKDKTTGAVLPASKVRFLGKGDLVSEGFTDKRGTYVYEEDCVKDVIYEIRASKRPVYGTAQSQTEVYKDKTNSRQQYVLDLVPEFKQALGKIVVKINPIYFDYDESFIRDDARVELDKVVEVMRKYPNINIEAGSHTDSRGRDRYNQKLSERRAQSTVDYITTQGISTDRIHYRGYGETQLVNGCKNGVKCTKAEHQMNRRTEFVILNPEVLK